MKTSKDEVTKPSFEEALDELIVKRGPLLQRLADSDEVTETGSAVQAGTCGAVPERVA
jgi:hypothetical protein